MSGAILVIEDEPLVRDLVAFNLQHAGYAVQAVTTFADGLSQLLQRERYALAIVDVMLPGGDGIELVRRVRQQGISTPVLLLTARGESTTKVRGFDVGADDYVTKPFSPRELVSRVKANLRRARVVPVQEDPIRVGDIEVDPAARTVMRDGEDIPITFSEFEILLKLMKSPRRVFTREELMDHLWDGSFYGDLRSVDVHVRHLRQKIERDPANPVIIRTVRGVGYALGREDGSAE